MKYLLEFLAIYWEFEYIRFKFHFLSTIELHVKNVNKKIQSDLQVMIKWFSKYIL